MWSRCRIVSIGTITEGGANQTSIVAYSDGKVTIAGGTDSVPATFTDLYNWCVTNIPYVTVSKTCVGSRQVAQYGWVYITDDSGWNGVWDSLRWDITGYTTENYNYNCSATEAVTRSYWVDTTKVVVEPRWTDTSYYKTETYWVDTSGWVTDTTINTTYYP
jgi:hypothetical protein